MRPHRSLLMTFWVLGLAGCLVEGRVGEEADLTAGEDAPALAETSPTPDGDAAAHEVADDGDAASPTEPAPVACLKLVDVPAPPCAAPGETATTHVEVTACGTLPVSLDGFALVGPEAELFSVAAPPAGSVLQAGESASVEVTYAPTATGVHEAWVQVASDALEGPMEVFLRGRASPFIADYCGEPWFTLQPGGKAIPQTKVSLFGPELTPAGAAITAYQWSVEQPPGSKSLFQPSFDVGEPKLEANVAGLYAFHLHVFPEEGPKQYAGFLMVQVEPEAAIHIELLWHTPNDPDETDEGPQAGADLDLHFMHPYATGYDVDGDGVKDGWFDNPFDVFWFNPNPEWGAFGETDDNPSLDRDDTDGAGPENINLATPEDGMGYRVGVHYWNDHGFGDSLATVRVFVKGALVFEASRWMSREELCEFGTLSWPDGEFTPAGEGPDGALCSPNFKHPLFVGQ